jgi:sulfide:quinone oxidoreductase
MRTNNKKNLIDRRKFIELMASASSLTAFSNFAFADKISTKAKIVILGAGAGGLAVANRLANRLDGAKITIIDGRKQHWYQPGFMLIGSGLKKPSYSITKTTDWISDGIDLIPEYAYELDPEAKYLITATRKKITYDYLVVAPGLILDWSKIEGFDLNMVGKEGIAAIYAGPEHAQKSYQALSKFTDKGGHGLFFHPGTKIKCGAAPLQYTFITDDIARTRGNRGKVEITYASHSKKFIGIPKVNEKVTGLFKERNVDVAYQHVIKSIDHGKKIATFKSPEGNVELPYDFAHVIPPQRVPDVIFNSPLPSENKKWANQGWIDVNKNTLRHSRYPEIFGCGDVTGVPTGKAASVVKWMAPVIEDQLVAQITGKQATKTYNGYAACPLVTRIGRALLIEIDYSKKFVPTFPGVIDPIEELWASWLVKVSMKPSYYAVLRGKA